MFGQRIRQYMRENGISNRYVAKRSGIDEKKLSRLLNGQKMSVEEYAAICRGLGVDLNFFSDDNFLETRNQTA